MWNRIYYILKSKLYYWLNSKQKKITMVQKNINKVLCLEPYLFKEMKVSKACTYLINTYYLNIDDFIVSLDLFNRLIEMKIEVNPEKVLIDPKEITINNFFTNSLSYKLNSELSIIQFKEQAIRFFRNYESIKDSKIETDILNIVYLRSVPIEILNITKQLLEFCYD